MSVNPPATSAIEARRGAGYLAGGATFRPPQVSMHASLIRGAVANDFMPVGRVPARPALLLFAWSCMLCAACQSGDETTVRRGTPPAAGAPAAPPSAAPSPMPSPAPWGDQPVAVLTQPTGGGP